MGKHTVEELQQWQALPLSIKILMTKERIREWVKEYGLDGVYVSFSGGKDSTVLLHMSREMYPNIKAVFVDTGLEYPEIRDFVKSFDNVDWLKPKMTFKQVIDKYGYPFITKEVSGCVYWARKYFKKLNSKEKPAQNTRLKKLLGTLEHKEKGVLTGEVSQMYDRSRYKFFLEADFEISDKCCDVMKKEPVHRYGKSTGRKPITAQMASESKRRTQEWIQNGCNGFDMKAPISNPMAFWTEQDVLLYIKENNLPIASVYGEVVTDEGAECDGQITMSDFGIFDNERKLLKTTGCERTGCMFCGYGCHLEKSPNRFERMRETHPKVYDYIMRPTEQGGLNYKEIIDWMNENGNMNIKY